MMDIPRDKSITSIPRTKQRILIFKIAPRTPPTSMEQPASHVQVKNPTLILFTEGVKLVYKDHNMTLIAMNVSAIVVSMCSKVPLWVNWQLGYSRITLKSTKREICIESSSDRVIKISFVHLLSFNINIPKIHKLKKIQVRSDSMQSLLN